MNVFLIIACVILCAAALVLLVFHIKTAKPLKSVVIHAAVGLALFAAVNLISRYTGVKIPVNIYSITSAAVLGVPAVCGFLILNLIC